MNAYDPKDIEKKWQEKWLLDGLYTTSEEPKEKKAYILDMFPYPSGEGLHVGHPKGYIATDVLSRMKRMQGYDVLHPMGFDSFGLPAENYAIKHKRHPREFTEKNIARYNEQLAALGFDYDPNRQVSTCEPIYYRWTQWIFIQLLKRGLAYESHEPINWCPSCKTGLANEDLQDGKCERCGSVVEKKPIRQWVLKITDYAARLLADIENLDWPESVKAAQRAWIGKSEGHEIEFQVSSFEFRIKIFTTRIDTLFGATYLVLAPEHELVERLADKITNYAEVKSYVENAAKKQEMERTAEEKDKTGIELKGVTAINPANGEEIPIWIGDYVLANYGTGAIMAVPAHDERDFAFAKKYNLPITQVIAPEFGEKRENEERRDGGGGIIFDPKTQKYAIAKNISGLYGVFGGGVDKDEDLERGITREVSEESGLFDFGTIEKGATCYAHYHNSLRKVNRFTVSTNFLFILNSAEIKEIKHEAHETFVLDWRTADEIISNWDSDPGKGDLGHWLFQFKWAVGRAIELGSDTTSDTNKFYTSAYGGDGLLINSGEFSELSVHEAKEKIAAKVSAKKKTTYKLRDWVFSRQRYWGEPIPVVHCLLCGAVPVDEAELPIELPAVENYEPTGTGESPLAAIEEWVNTICPQCGGPGKRETNTMPGWAGSSWYYIAYAMGEYLRSPESVPDIIADPNLKKVINTWLPVDVYEGGSEHITRHMLYARFWHKFLCDIELITAPEPFLRYYPIGLILSHDGRKMSKRWGNVVNPDDMILRYGADSMRLYEMFMGPFENAIAWNEEGIVGSRRFIERVWSLQSKVESDKLKVGTGDIEILLNQTIKKVSENIAEFKFNTAISSMMILVNELTRQEFIEAKTYEILVKLMAPFTPHVAEELWAVMHSKSGSVHLEQWPVYDAEKLQSTSTELVIQINGKIRGRIPTERGLSEKEAIDMAYSDPQVKKWLPAGHPKKTIYIPDKLLNIVV